MSVANMRACVEERGGLLMPQECSALLDIAEAARLMEAVLVANGMGVGLLRHPPHAEVYTRFRASLRRAANSQSNPVQ